MLDLPDLTVIPEREAQAVKCLELLLTPGDLPWRPQPVLVMGLMKTWPTLCMGGVGVGQEVRGAASRVTCLQRGLHRVPGPLWLCQAHLRYPSSSWSGSWLLRTMQEMTPEWKGLFRLVGKGEIRAGVRSWS